MALHFTAGNIKSDIGKKLKLSHYNPLLGSEFVAESPGEKFTCDEFGTKIFDNAFDCTALKCLCFHSLEIFFSLAEVCTETNNVKSLFNEPNQNDGGVQAA